MRKLNYIILQGDGKTRIHASLDDIEAVRDRVQPSMVIGIEWTPSAGRERKTGRELYPSENANCLECDVNGGGHLTTCSKAASLSVLA